jgi:hypothetical protein
MIAIQCPNCGTMGLVSMRAIGAVNDDLDVLAYCAPKGFRKVQVGWSNEAVSLFCVSCGVPAETADRGLLPSVGPGVMLE